jgi:hypothetical protein
MAGAATKQKTKQQQTPFLFWHSSTVKRGRLEPSSAQARPSNKSKLGSFYFDFLKCDRIYRK